MTDDCMQTIYQFEYVIMLAVIVYTFDLIRQMIDLI